MTTLNEVWPYLTGPRVEDSWVEVLEVHAAVPKGTTVVANDFEDATLMGWGTNWYGSPGAVTLSNTSSAAHSGARSLEITYPTAAAGAGPQRIVTGLVPGTRYTAEAYVYVPSATPSVNFGDPYGGTPTVQSDVKDDWQLVQFTWIASVATVYITVRASSATTSGMKAWVDDFHVYEGYPGSPAQERVLGFLDGVQSCSVEQNVNATIRGGMSLSMREGTDGPLDWARVRFRPWVRVNGMTWPLGVYLPASPSLTHDEFGRAWSVPCLDKTSILDQDAVTETYTVAAGTVVTTEVAAIIIGTGELSLAITPSPLTTRSAMTWEPGTTKLRIINDLLDSINYFALWADRRGRFRAEPYRRPQDRALAATFASGEASIHSPDWSREIDIAAVPNRVVLVVDGDDENDGMVSSTDNTDPDSPYSIPSRGGRVVTRTYTNVEAADQPTLDALARRYLRDASNPSAVLSVRHASVPLDPNAVVRFVSDGVDTLATVEAFSLSLEAGALMSGTWREVVSE